MLGLICKDLYCLKKSLRQFLFVTFGVILLAVLFLLSARQGNVAKGIAVMQAEGEMTEGEFYALFQIAVWLILLIPEAFVCMIVECFKADQKAGFYKCVMSLPLQEYEIVGSRYACCMLIAAVGMAGSFVAAILVSMTSGVYAFEKLFGAVAVFTAVLLIYMSFVMFMLYLLGVEKADLIQCAPFVVLLLSAFIAVQRKLQGMSEPELDSFLEELTNRGPIRFLENYWGAMLLLAVLCLAVSFWGSCKILKMRRGKL